MHAPKEVNETRGSLQEHLLALHKKLEFVRNNEMATKSAAMQDIAPELERLRAKAVTKSRDLLMARLINFLFRTELPISRLLGGRHVLPYNMMLVCLCYPGLPRIYQLRKPKTNIQILQQNVLLKQKYLVTFLRQHGPEVFQEVRMAYVETLSRVLSAHFRSYLAALERLQVSPKPHHSVNIVHVVIIIIAELANPN